MTVVKRNVSESAAKARLPVRSDLPANTVGLGTVLEQLRERPEVLGLSEIDPAAVVTGLALRKARRAAGLTQARVAELTGITQSAISNIERGAGKDGPSARVVRQIAAAIGAEWVLKPIAEAVPAPQADAKDFAQIVKVTTGKKKLNFMGAGGNLGECWPIVKSVLPRAAYEEVIQALSDVSRRRRALTEFASGAVCGFWQLEPHGRSRLSVRAPVLALAYHGRGRVAVPDRPSMPGFDQVVVAETDQTIELQNEGGEALSVMTVLLPASADKCLAEG